MLPNFSASFPHSAIVCVCMCMVSGKNKQMFVFRMLTPYGAAERGMFVEHTNTLSVSECVMPSILVLWSEKKTHTHTHTLEYVFFESLLLSLLSVSVQ